MQSNSTASSADTKWKRRKDARPEEILQAALSQFSMRGFAATRLEEVAKSAGISKGTLYLYFESKESLFKAVVTELVIPEIDRAEAEFTQYKGKASDLIRKMLIQWWDTVGETELCGLPKLVISEADNFPDVARFYVENVIQRVRGILKDVIKLGIESGEFKDSNPDYVVRVLLSPLVFAAVWKSSLAPYDSQTYDVKEYIDTHLSLFFQGLNKK